MGGVHLFPGIAGTHLKQLLDRDLLLPGVRDLLRDFREEVDHRLIDFRQKPLIQGDADQCGGITLRHRLHAGLLLK